MKPTSVKKSIATRRQGTLNQGIPYEIKTCALLALRFVDENFGIRDYEIWQNVDDFGNFDDVVIKLIKRNGQVLKFCMQLKHFQMDGTSRQKSLKFSHFYDAPRSKMKKPFNLMNYWKSLESVKGPRRKEENIRYVLFTNKHRDGSEPRFVPYDREDVDLINIGGEAFFFEEFKIPKTDQNCKESDTEEFDEIDAKFLRKLVILCSQPHEEDLNNIIKSTFQTIYKLDAVKTSEIVAKYLEHITNWVNGYCGMRCLTKDEIKFKLGEFALNSHLYRFQPSYDDFSDGAVQNWTKIIDKYKAVLIEKCRSKKIYQECLSFVLYNVHVVMKNYTPITNWILEFSEEDLRLLNEKVQNLNVSQEINELWGDEKVNQVTLQKIYFYMWKHNILPLVLRIETEEELKSLLAIRNLVPGKLVLLYSKCVAQNDFFDGKLDEDGELKILRGFANLQDMDKDLILEQYATIQGRKSKIKHVIATDELRSRLSISDIIQILLEDFKVGGKMFALPNLFVHRRLCNILVKADVFSEQHVYIIFCESRDIFAKYVSENELKLEETHIGQLSKYGRSSLSSFENLTPEITTCKLPENCKILLNADYEINEVKRAINNKTKARVKYSIAIIEKIDDTLTLSFTDAVPIQTIYVVLSTKDTLMAYLELNDIKVYSCEIYNFSEIDFKNMPFTCKYIIASETESKAIRNIPLSKIVSLDFYKLNLENEIYKLEFLGSFVTSNKVAEFRLANTGMANFENESKFEFENCFHYNKLNIITGSPGMGKSVLTNYLISTCPPDLWTVLINFTVHSKYLMEHTLGHDKTTEIMKHFIGYENKSALEQSVVDTFLKNGKICLFFDGYDEIPPEAEAKICVFLQNLVQKGFLLFITTRNVKADILEESLKSVARKIMPFDETDQFEYLTKYYKSKIQDLGEHEAKVDEFVQKLLQITKSNMSPWDTEFSGVPLQTLMISEIYLSECRKFCYSTKKDVNVHMDVLYLYEQFINLKVSNLQSKENIHNPCIAAYFKRAIKLSLENHKHCALKAIFSTSLPQVQVKDYIREIQNGDDKIGLIDRFLDGETPVFVHRTFAEYLTALYISENLQKSFIQYVFTTILKHSVYDIIRQILDRLLAKDCPLHRALLNRDMRIFGILLKDKSELMKVDRGGRNVLHVAMSWGSRHWVPTSDVLEDMNSQFGWGNFLSKLEQAYQASRQAKRSEDFVIRVLQNTPSLLYQKDQVLRGTPLDYAIKVLALENVDLYLGLVFKLNNSFSSVETNLKTLWKYKILKDANTDMIYGYSQILFLCSMYDYEWVMLAILRLKPLFFGNVANTTYGKCKTSLMHFSAYFQANRVIDTLINEGVDVDMTDTRRNQSALHWAAGKGHLSTVKLLVDRKAHVKLYDLKSRRPLYLASENRHTEIAQLLSDAESQIGGMQTKITELFVASNVGDLEDVDRLLQEGADVNEKSDGGMIPLCAAAYQGHFDVVKLLLEFGADIDAVDNDHWSALMQAAWRGHADVVRLLLAKGANPRIVAKGLWTSLTVALDGGTKTEVVKLLQDAGAL